VTVPTWTHVAVDWLDFSECEDPQQVAFDSWAREQLGYAVAEFDRWILQQADRAPEYFELLVKRRQQAFAAYLRDDTEVAELAYECLWRARRMRAVTPFVRTGAKVRRPHLESNKRRQVEAQALYAEWQARAVAKWAEPQHADKFASDIARLIAKPGENPDTIRRRIRKPS
jgi:hypothetical protein